MLIRAFLPHDLTRLVDLTIETFGPFYEDSFRPVVGGLVFTIQHGDWRGDYRRVIPELHDPDQHKHVAVAEFDGAVAGYVAWSVEPDRRYGSISHLAVSAEHRRSGAATDLCEHAFAEMRTAGAAMVEIGTGGDPFHAPARALYERLGCIPFPVTFYYREL
jgi:ribosomal protein S18 acetylase RimI-like enzyme